MTIENIAFGFFVYFIGLFFAGFFAIILKNWKKSIQLFSIINFIGFFCGISYLFNFPTKTIVLFNLQWFFSFSPSLTLLSGIFFTLISGVSALVSLYSLRYFELYENKYNLFLVQFLTVLFIFGMQGVLFANNSFTFLFFWEIMSVSSFFLVMSEKTTQSVKAAFLYFIMTHLGAASIMAGFLILSSGNLFFDINNIKVASTQLSSSSVTLAFIFFFFGFGSKAGIVPFHIWLPEAHPEAPSNISAIMSGLMLKIAIYGFIKIVFSIVGIPIWASVLVIALGIVSAISGALFAAIEKDIKKVFAYSSIENLGIIFAMLGTSLFLFSKNISAGIQIANIIFIFAIFLSINHAIFKTALFLSSGVIMSRFHLRSLEKMGGLSKIMPFFSIIFLLIILSSLPIPLFGTFYGEWGFIENIINIFYINEFDSSVIGMLLGVLSFIGIVSGIAVVAMVRVFGISMLGRSRSAHLEKYSEKKDILMIMPIAILSLVTLILGIFSRQIILWMINYKNNIINNFDNIEPFYAKSFSSSIFFIFFIFCLIAVYFIKNYFVKNKRERVYKTWDCGQEIDSTMEYTATAFSAPIRFFFLPLLGSKKYLTSKPIVETNKWIRKYYFTLHLRSFWRDKIYRPFVDFLLFIAENIKIIQAGRIQYYLLFLFITLIITLIVAL